MRVLHLFISLPVGGAEDLVAQIMRDSSKDMHLSILCLRDEGVVGAELRAQGFPVVVLPLSPHKQTHLLAFFRLARWLKKNRIDVVHSHVYNSHVFGGIAALLAGCKFVFHHHKTHTRMRWRRRLILGFLARRATANITLSRKTAEDLVSVFSLAPRTTHVLPNPIDPSTFFPPSDLKSIRRGLGRPADGLLIGTAASLTPPKNHEANLHLAHSLQTIGFSGRFLLLGQGPLEQALKLRAQSLHLHQVEFLGARRPLAPWLQILDLFVLASSWEGQPMVLLQAMSCGLPIVASRIEGNVDVLGPGHAGLFDLDEPDAYFTKVMGVLRTPELRHQILEQQNSRLALWQDTHAYVNRLGSIYHPQT